jgi:hypothetical protein
MWPSRRPTDAETLAKHRETLEGAQDLPEDEEEQFESFF